MDEEFTKEALKAQDGKRVPLTLGTGGPVIGEAIFRYEEDTNTLKFETRYNKGIEVKIGPWLTDASK